MSRILIIGATSAIASACAREWAREGSQFFLVARNDEKLQQVTADLLGRGAQSVESFVMDANDIEAHSAMLDQCLMTMKQIDVALIAHGTLPDQKVCESDAAIALQEFSSNGTSVIALLTILANHMEVQRCGTMAVISSVAGDRGRPSNYLYGASKAAVSAFCEGLRARMYKVGVHVMTIKPGFVDTPMTQGLKLPAALVTSADVVGALIVRHIKKKTNVLYAPRFWSLIMLVIRSIPQMIFKKISL